jgi:hypothetical protein
MFTDFFKNVYNYDHTLHIILKVKWYFAKLQATWNVRCKVVIFYSYHFTPEKATSTQALIDLRS